MAVMLLCWVYYILTLGKSLDGELCSIYFHTLLSSYSYREAWRRLAVLVGLL